MAASSCLGQRRVRWVGRRRRFNAGLMPADPLPCEKTGAPHGQQQDRRGQRYGCEPTGLPSSSSTSSIPSTCSYRTRPGPGSKSALGSGKSKNGNRGEWLGIGTVSNTRRHGTRQSIEAYSPRIYDPGPERVKQQLDIPGVAEEEQVIAESEAPGLDDHVGKPKRCIDLRGSIVKITGKSACSNRTRPSETTVVPSMAGPRPPKTRAAPKRRCVSARP